jgi:hypothetical protein
MRRYFFALLVATLLVSGNAEALQFSANAVMSAPGRADVSTFLYYSNGRIRKEFYYYGEPVVQILDANKHKSLMCFTEQKLCYENTSLEEINIGIENAMTSACKNNKSLNCENLGEVELGKRKATKWKVVSKQGKKKEVSYLWMDKELNIPIRQKLANGTQIELQWLGREKLNNRDTDKWLQKIKLPNGIKQESYQWFDRELKISIRESFPDGNTQELKNIVVQKFKDPLFATPPGYRLKVVKSADLKSESKKVKAKPKAKSKAKSKKTTPVTKPVDTPKPKPVNKSASPVTGEQ